MVLFLHRQKGVYKEKEEWAQAEKGDPGSAELIIAKQRNGPIGKFNLTFLREYTRFVDQTGETMPVD